MLFLINYCLLVEIILLENDEVCSSINVVFYVYSQSTLGCLGFLNVSTNDKISTASYLWRIKFDQKSI